MKYACLTFCLFMFMSCIPTVEDTEDIEDLLAKDRHIIANYYPKKVSNILTIETYISLFEYEFEILDSTGKIRIKGYIHEGGNEIGCRFIPPGTYLLVVKNCKDSIYFEKI